MGSADINEEARRHSWIGDPSGDEQTSGPVRWQRFGSGATVVASPRGVHTVYGAIATKWWGVGGPTAGLGAPTTGELDAGDGVGRYNDFEHGSIYWSPTTGAHEVHGGIGERWVADGRVAGPLGYPITDELSHRPYAYQYFQRGSLRWTPATGVRRGCPPDRLFGVADTHAHPAAHLGFGGRLLTGTVEGPPEQALAACDGPHGAGGTGVEAVAAILGGLLGVAATAGTIGALWGLEGSLGHRTHGWPDFDGWPRHDSRVHQQMYLPWVHRAYLHGVRVMVALANHSELLARAVPGGGPTGDHEAGMAQIDYLKELIGRTPWMGLARSPQEARDIVAEDRMAVILGLELDTLGGITQPADWSSGAAPVTDAELDALVQQLWNRDVRYVFPIHLTDNAFGGCAVYNEMFMAASFEAGRGIVSQSDERVSFRPTFTVGEPLPPRGGIVNSVGLSDAGRRFLTRLMDAGMLIDIDHMSWRSTDDALLMAESRKYPLVSGHATFHELATPEQDDTHSGRDESRKTKDTLQRLHRLGSFVGVQPVAQRHAPAPSVDGRVRTDCPGSSSGFARALLWASDALGGRVAIGTDFNGFAKTCGARFGPTAAVGLPAENARRLVEEVQRDGVRYTGGLTDPVEQRFDRPGRMWSDVRRLLLWAVVLVEAGSEAPPEVSVGHDVHVPAVVAGLRAGSEPPGGQERAAYRARRGMDHGPLTGFDRTVHAELRWVLDRWAAAGSGPNPPIERCRTGDHDWDYNIEGLAHYGLLPDLLSDLGNVGLAWDTALMPLLTSAETVVDTWERCVDPSRRDSPLHRPQDDRTLDPGRVQVLKKSAADPASKKAGIRLPPA